MSYILYNTTNNNYHDTLLIRHETIKRCINDDNQRMSYILYITENNNYNDTFLTRHETIKRCIYDDNQITNCNRKYDAEPIDVNYILLNG